MTFTHGVTSSEIASPTRALGTMANPLAYIGKAKISGKTAGQFALTAGRWTRLETRADAVAFLGTDTASAQISFDLAERANDYTIPGFLGEFFDTAKLKDILVYNVANFTTVTDTSVALGSSVYTLANGYVKDLTVTDTAAAAKLENTHYTYNHKTGVITPITGSGMTAVTTILVDYKYANTSAAAVTADDIQSACASLDTIFQQHGIVPSILIAPRLTNLTADTTHKVISGMKTATDLMDATYHCRAIVGIEEASKADMADQVLSAIATTDPDVDYVAHFPNGLTELAPDEVYALQWLINAAETNGIIGVNPASNEFVDINTPSAPFKDSDANTLNDDGINTFVSHNGMKTWGNYTSSYSETGEFMENFSSIRFILIWIKNNCNYYTRTFMVDKETNPRKINYHLGNMQKNYIDKAIRAGALLKGSKILFDIDDNPTVDLLAGKYVYNFSLGFIPPATSITNEYWFNDTLLVNLFEGAE
jgi:phage tail sheath protein FI